MIETNFGLVPFGIGDRVGIAKLFTANVTEMYSVGDSYISYYYEPPSRFSDGEKVWSYVTGHNRNQSLLELMYKIMNKKYVVSRAEVVKIVGEEIVIAWEDTIDVEC